MAESYFELLRRPEWQKKRLVVMEAAGFECANCGAKDKTLNVHHRYYLKGHKPWEYPDEHFDCLCEPCHKAEHAKRDELNVVMATGGSNTERMIGYAKALLLLDRACPDDNTRVVVGSYEEAVGMADAYGISGSRAVDDIVTAASASGDSAVDHTILWGVAVAHKSPSAIIDLCREFGVHLSALPDGRLAIRFPAELPAPIRAALVENKPAIIALLNAAAPVGA